MSTRKGKKISGGKYIARRKKKSYEIAGQKRIVKIGEEKRKTVKTTGGNKKTYLLRANRFLARQNILTKGTIVETDLGKVQISNRPTQEGVVNGILI